MNIKKINAILSSLDSLDSRKDIHWHDKERILQLKQCIDALKHIEVNFDKHSSVLTAVENMEEIYKNLLEYYLSHDAHFAEALRRSLHVDRVDIKTINSKRDELVKLIEQMEHIVAKLGHEAVTQEDYDNRKKYLERWNFDFNAHPELGKILILQWDDTYGVYRTIYPHGFQADYDFLKPFSVRIPAIEQIITLSSWHVISDLLQKSEEFDMSPQKVFDLLEEKESIIKHLKNKAVFIRFIPLIEQNKSNARCFYDAAETLESCGLLDEVLFPKLLDCFDAVLKSTKKFDLSLSDKVVEKVIPFFIRGGVDAEQLLTFLSEVSRLPGNLEFFQYTTFIYKYSQPPNDIYGFYCSEFETMKNISYKELTCFLMLLVYNKKQMQSTLKHVVSAFLANDVSKSSAHIEEVLPHLRSVYTKAIGLRGLDSDSRFFLRKLAVYIPGLAGSDMGALINNIRNLAESVGKDLQLTSVQYKIHDAPGIEDIQIIQALFNLVSDPEEPKLLEYKEACKPYTQLDSDANRSTIDFFKGLDESQQEKTLNELSHLVQDLKELWHPNAHHLRQLFSHIVDMATQRNANWPKLSNAIDKLLSDLEKGAFEHIAQTIGSVRKQMSDAITKSSGNMREELHLFDLAIEGIEHIAYAEAHQSLVQGSSQGILNEAQLQQALSHIRQILSSVLASGLGYFSSKNQVYVTKPLYKAQVLLQKYFIAQKQSGHEEKNAVADLVEIMNLVNKGVTVYSEVVVSDVRKLVRSKLDGSSFQESDVEKRVAPLYKTGSIYVLGELAVHVLNYLTGGQGHTAHPGEVYGQVRVIRTQNDIKSFRQGEVLIARNPTPEINVALMSSSAIITEEGGTTSHAAMIAREWNKPCIVGRSRVLEDFNTGDFVHVNATEGFLQKISEEEYNQHKGDTPLTNLRVDLRNLSFHNLFDLSEFAKKTNKKYVVGLDEAKDMELVGGKAYNLHRLRALARKNNLSVPDGFVVTVDAFIESIAANIHRLDELGDISKVSEKQVLKVFESLPIPPAIVEGIRVAYSKLGRSHVSIRSSATTEDTSESTFAGLHETFLFRRGIQQILLNIKRCWASLYTHRAMLHRNMLKIEEHKAKMAVVVQKMVYADFSGVCYTTITEDFKSMKQTFSKSRASMKVEIVLGHGEELVSGSKTPMLFIVNKNDGSFRQISGRPSEQVNSLFPEMISTFTKIEEEQESAQDIEFCAKNNKLYILQTRSIK